MRLSFGAGEMKCPKLKPKKLKRSAVSAGLNGKVTVGPSFARIVVLTKEICSDQITPNTAAQNASDAVCCYLTNNGNKKMKLIGYRPDINSAEWHGPFVHIAHYVSMADITLAVQELCDDKGINDIELRVYNDSSSYTTFTPDEKNHIGFISCKRRDLGEYEVRHFTTNKEPVFYKNWDAVKFYQGR